MALIDRAFLHGRAFAPFAKSAILLGFAFCSAVSLQDCDAMTAVLCPLALGFAVKSLGTDAAMTPIVRCNAGSVEANATLTTE